MKLLDTILFSLAVALFIIGVHQTFTVGLLESYWIFMICIGLLFTYKLRKRATAATESALPSVDAKTAAKEAKGASKRHPSAKVHKTARK